MKLINSSRPYALYTWNYFEKKQTAFDMKSIELFGATPHIWTDHLGYIIPDELRRTGLDLVMYTPKPYNYSFCAVDRDQMEKTAAYYRFCVDAAKELGISDVTVTVSGGSLDADREQRHENAVSQIRSIAQYAGEQGLKINITPYGKQSESEAFDLESTHRIITEAACGNIYVMPDTANMASHGETIEGWFEKMGDRINCLRLRDSDGKSEVPAGEGILPVEDSIKYLNSIGFRGSLCMELGSDDFWDDPAKWDGMSIGNMRTIVERLV